MNLRNYTSGVPVARSISAIEELLMEANVSHISKVVENGKVKGFYFQISVNNMPISFKLPCQPEANICRRNVRYQAASFHDVVPAIVISIIWQSVLV